MGASRAVEVVEGVSLNKVDPDRISEIAHSLGIVSSGMAKTVAAISQKYAEMDDSKLADCDYCGGSSHKELDRCAYCGLTDEETHDSAAANSSSIADSSRALTLVAPAPARKVASVIAGSKKTVEGKIISPGEAQLDDAVVRINTAKRDTASAYWRLGREILAVHKSLAWKYRDKGGKPAYRGFDDFVRNELHLAKSVVYGMMKLAEHYSVDDLSKFGVNRLELILMAPEKKQAEFAEYVKSGGKDGSPLTRKKAREKLRELRAQVSKESDKPRVGRPPAPVLVANENELTLATVMGKKHKLPMWALSKDREGNRAAAKSIEDQPWTHLDLKNGVRIVAKLGKLPTGQFQLLMSFDREEA